MNLDNLLKKLSLLLCGLVLMTGQISSAADTGGTSGGGGDATEMGVDLIRAGLLNWIRTGAARDLQFPQNVSYDDYVKAMTEYLAPKYVVVSFVTTEQENSTTDPEQQVIVDGVKKGCRGFVSVRDRLPHILCNSDRYPKSGAAQYRLIHHEYAGLAGVEKNTGAASDYTLSQQLSEFGGYDTVYRLHATRRARTATAVLDTPTKDNTVAIIIGVCEGHKYPGYLEGTDSRAQVDGLLALAADLPNCQTVIGVEKLPAIGSLVRLESEVDALSTFPKMAARVVGKLQAGTVLRILSYAGYGGSVFGFGRGTEMYAAVQVVERP